MHMDASIKTINNDKPMAVLSTERGASPLYLYEPSEMDKLNPKVLLRDQSSPRSLAQSKSHTGTNFNQVAANTQNLQKVAPPKKQITTKFN